MLSLLSLILLSAPIRAQLWHAQLRGKRIPDLISGAVTFEI